MTFSLPAFSYSRALPTPTTPMSINPPARLVRRSDSDAHSTAFSSIPVVPVIIPNRKVLAPAAGIPAFSSPGWALAYSTNPAKSSYGASAGTARVENPLSWRQAIRVKSLMGFTSAFPVMYWIFRAEVATVRVVPSALEDATVWWPTVLLS